MAVLFYGGENYTTVFGFKILSGLLGDDTKKVTEVVGSESDYIAKVDGVSYPIAKRIIEALNKAEDKNEGLNEDKCEDINQENENDSKVD